MTKKITTEPKAPDTFRAIVSADYFRRAMVACSSEDSRYYLNGVYIASDPRGGAILAATDGHMLVVIRDPKAICRGSGIVKLNKAMRAALTSKTPSGFHANTGPYLLVDQNPDRYNQSRAYVAHMDDSLAAPGRSTKIDVDQPYSALASIFDTMDGRVVAYQGYDLLIDGAFPDFRRVVPKALPGSILPPTISAKVMNQLYTALTTGAKGKPLGHLTFFQCDEGETATEVRSPIMAIPGPLDQEPFEAFGIAMPMRASSAKNAPPLWWLHFMTPESGGPKRKTGGLSDADVEHLKPVVPDAGSVVIAANRDKADLSGVEAQKAVMATSTPETPETPATPPQANVSDGTGRLPIYRVEYSDGELVDCYPHGEGWRINAIAHAKKSKARVRCVDSPLEGEVGRPDRIVADFTFEMETESGAFELPYDPGLEG